MIRHFIAAAALLSVAACQSNSKEFAAPTTENLRLGETTHAEALTIYGAPYTEETVTDSARTSLNAPAEPLSVARLIYNYRDPLEMALSGSQWGRGRKLTLNFAGERLISYVYTSTFRVDHTNFDEKKISQLANGTTTRAEIAALFGKPSGRSIFPVVPAGMEGEIYAFEQVGVRWLVTKRLDLIIDRDGVLQDFTFASETLPIYRQTNVPVYVPVK